MKAMISLYLVCTISHLNYDAEFYMCEKKNIYLSKKQKTLNKNKNAPSSHIIFILISFTPFPTCVLAHILSQLRSSF